MIPIILVIVVWVVFLLIDSLSLPRFWNRQSDFSEA